MMNKVVRETPNERRNNRSLIRHSKGKEEVFKEKEKEKRERRFLSSSPGVFFFFRAS